MRTRARVLLVMVTIFFWWLAHYLPFVGFGDIFWIAGAMALVSSLFSSKFEPRDWWVGVYFDDERSRIYIILFPCFPIIIENGVLK